MPQPEPGLSAAWRDVAEAGLTYYTRLGGLALALAETIVPAVGDLRPTVQRTPAAAPEPAAEAPGQTIVLEAAAGKSGIGVFVVENTTASKVSTTVGVSALVDDSGREVNPDVTFVPAIVTLDPGDQVLVQVAAAVDAKLEPGVRYRGEISIPRLSTAGIPLVVRRTRARAPRRTSSP